MGVEQEGLLGSVVSGLELEAEQRDSTLWWSGSKFQDSKEVGLLSYRKAGASPW